ncbi:unnamed protein product [Musa hybrid cultivar]
MTVLIGFGFVNGVENWSPLPTSANPFTTIPGHVPLQPRDLPLPPDGYFREHLRSATTIRLLPPPLRSVASVEQDLHLPVGKPGPDSAHGQQQVDRPRPQLLVRPHCVGAPGPFHHVCARHHAAEKLHHDLGGGGRCLHESDDAVDAHELGRRPRLRPQLHARCPITHSFMYSYAVGLTLLSLHTYKYNI